MDKMDEMDTIGATLSTKQLTSSTSASVCVRVCVCVFVELNWSQTIDFAGWSLL